MEILPKLYRQSQNFNVLRHFAKAKTKQTLYNIRIAGAIKQIYNFV